MQNVMGSTITRTASAGPQDILMHELVDHAIPKVAPDPEIDTGNAVENENKIRKELNQVLRQKDENHKQ